MLLVYYQTFADVEGVSEDEFVMGLVKMVEGIGFVVGVVYNVRCALGIAMDWDTRNGMGVLDGAGRWISLLHVVFSDC